jgi:hypothetical protein
MNTKHKGILIGAMVAVLLGLAVFANQSQSEPVSDPVSAEPSSEQQAEISADGGQVAYKGVGGETALQTLRDLVEVEVESSEFGDYVTSIDGLGADSDSEYWAFYVNGEPAAVGAGSYQAVEGDEIEWRLEAF